MTRAVIFDMYETLITHYNSPLYFGSQMAEDAGIPEDSFQSLWRPTEHERSIGKLTLEDVVKKILLENLFDSEMIFRTIIEKRISAKEECFRHLHPEIIPMLSTLKKRGFLIGLISNCFSEEADVIRKSELYQYFDAIYLSYEQEIQKPEEEIYRRCMDSLSVKAEECIYVGDGGSNELETARKLGMTAVQAVWYLQEGTTQPSKRKHDFIQIEQPLDVVKLVDLLLPSKEVNCE
ncbi:MAG: hydrolase superfamily [Firmicutes bacterium]|nr:hydrolase superfamily [Bacillota bacterium]